MVAAVAWRRQATLLAQDMDIERVARVIGIDIGPASPRSPEAPSAGPAAGGTCTTPVRAEYYTGASRADHGLAQRIGLAVSTVLNTWHRHGTRHQATRQNPIQRAP